LRVFDSFPAITVQGRKMVCVRLVCNDIHLLLQRNAVDIQPSPNSAKTKKISQQRLEAIQTLLEESYPPDSLTKTLMAERTYQLEVIRRLLPRSIASKYLMADAPALPERLALPPFTWYRMRIFFASAKYMRDMAWLIKISSQPWPGPLNELTGAKAKPSAKSSGLIPTAAMLSRLTAETFAIVRCTTTAIAIERYRLQNGRLPDGLADICPTYIKSIPTDPFTGQTLLYTRDDQSYTVYSTGANRADDGGTITAKTGEPTVLDTGIRIKHTSPK
jgi:hypothetical protein